MGDLLFMYLKPGETAILRDCEIRMSNPCWLNDPFDFKPGTLSDISDKELLAQLKDQSSNLYRVLDERIDRPLRQIVPKVTTFWELLASDETEALRVLKGRWSYIEDGVMELLCRDAENHWRLACFTLRDDGILLWTHYANKHRGFVVAFEREALDRAAENLFQQASRPDLPGGGHWPVEYRSTRPVIQHILVPREDMEKVFRDVVVTKSLEWAYEEESRILLPKVLFDPEAGIADCRCGPAVDEGCPRNGPGIQHSYWKFDPASVKQVIFGARSDPSDLQQKIREILSQPKFKHVELRQATPHRSRFEIEVKPVPSSA